MSEKERPSFEEALKKLESIVEKLGNQDITLEESVELYEEGLKLSKFCTETLENASLKIEQIDQDSGSQSQENE
ncbi:MAG: exodeoxyribonuclease VII small subunit [Balneolaceae bacterium]